MRNVTEYHRPRHLEEALALLARHNVRMVPLGGGSQLIAEARRDVEAVVDLRDLNLSYLKRDDHTLRVGATTTLQALIDSPESAAAWGGELARVVVRTAARNLREQRTIAGTLVSAESNCSLAVLLLALDATLTLFAPDRKTLSLGELYLHAAPTEVGAPRLITEIAIPLPRSGDAVAFEKVSRTPADEPIVCAAVKAKIEGGALREVRVALGGVGSKPQRLPTTEQVLETQSLEPVVQRIAEEIDPPSDFLGSAEYRRAMARVLVRRAIARLSRSQIGMVV